jgi:hypothetical protein
MVFYSGVLQSVLELSGHEHKTPDLSEEDIEDFDKYNEYGLSIMSESYSFSNGSGDYIRYLKLS